MQGASVPAGPAGPVVVGAGVRGPMVVGAGVRGPVMVGAGVPGPVMVGAGNQSPGEALRRAAMQVVSASWSSSRRWSMSSS
ncbi:hypothetical protein GCM10027075_47680 [Streptomyces heilongjiangensis]